VICAHRANISALNVCQFTY